MKKFIGRKKELKLLEQYKKKATSSFIVVRGRRRIGKSRLAEEFAKGMRFIKISGLPPTENPTPKDQRKHFADMLVRFGFSRATDDDWYNLFFHLAQNLSSEPTVLLFDEISWMASGDSSFLPKLKDIWDDHLKKHSNLIFILCGSVSSWIDKNILSSTAFFGRINEKVTLNELSLAESLKLLDQQGFKGSTMEKFMVLSVTGGVPWYIEQFMKGNTAEGHIRRLCFKNDGLFVSEFERIFSDLFDVRAAIYMKIVSQLSAGPQEYSTISKKADYGSGGTLSEYLSDLEVAGFIRKDKSWSFKTGVAQKLFMYRLSDNYLRFYLKYIQPYIDRIESGHFEETSISALKGFPTLIGLQFENLVLNNRQIVFEQLGINRQNIVADNPYFQRGGKTQAGCQIDYMIQTEFNALFICEMKFTKNIIRASVIQEMEVKIKALKKPKQLACLPVLIHFGEVSDEVMDSDFFYKIINFQEFFE